jgi:hypothetical protein
MVATVRVGDKVAKEDVGRASGRVNFRDPRFFCDRWKQSHNCLTVQRSFQRLRLEMEMTRAVIGATRVVVAVLGEDSLLASGHVAFHLNEGELSSERQLLNVLRVL